MGYARRVQFPNAPQHKARSRRTLLASVALGSLRRSFWHAGEQFHHHHR